MLFKNHVMQGKNASMRPREAPTRPPDGSQVAHMRPQDGPRSPLQPEKKLRLTRSVRTIRERNRSIAGTPRNVLPIAYHLCGARLGFQPPLVRNSNGIGPPGLLGRSGIHPSFGVVFGWYSVGIRWYSPPRGSLAISRCANAKSINLPTTPPTTARKCDVHV